MSRRSGFDINGVHLTPRDIRDRMNMVRRDAQEFAGQFFDACRSEKFRNAWREVGLRTGRDPQIAFVEDQWTHFVAHVRMTYCDMLRMERVSEQDKRKIHEAMVIQTQLGVQSQHVPLQIAPGTQAFEGERYENRQTAINFGTHAEPSLVRRLMSSTAH